MDSTTVTAAMAVQAAQDVFVCQVLAGLIVFMVVTAVVAAVLLVKWSPAETKEDGWQS